MDKDFCPNDTGWLGYGNVSTICILCVCVCMCLEIVFKIFAINNAKNTCVRSNQLEQEYQQHVYNNCAEEELPFTYKRN